MSPNWDGLYCALWTPTDADGRLLEKALRNNLELLTAKGVHGLLALGSTGEFLHLDVNLRQAIAERLAAWIKPMRLMVNVSDLRPRVVAQLADAARRAGAEAVSVLPPYFFPVAQEDLVEFFVRAGEAAQLPLFLYNFPERTGNRIDLETIAEVADRVPVAGVKQSGNEFLYHRQLVELGRQKRFVVLTGADTRLGEALPMGVAGCVSGLSNAVPEIVLQALGEARAGVSGASAVAGQRMTELGRRIQTVAFPLDVAAAMEARGLPTGSFKSIVSPATLARYQALVRGLQQLYREWGLI